MARLKWETVCRFSEGYIQAEISATDDTDKNGNPTRRYSWCLHKLLANGHTSKYFSAGDSASVHKLADKCASWIEEKEKISQQTMFE